MTKASDDGPGAEPTQGTETDPDLLAQLDAAGDGSVEAVFALHSGSRKTAPPAAQTERLAHELVTRVSEKVGRPAEAVQVFKHLGRFVVSADPDFVRELIDQPEVSAAMANRRTDSPKQQET